MQVAGVAEAVAREADADPGLVHHVEHVGQALVLLADQDSRRRRVRHRAVRAVAEVQQGVGRAAVAHLVVQADQRDVVARSPSAQELRHDEQRDALDPGPPPGVLASTRCTMFSVSSWSPPEIHILVPVIR